MTPPRVLVAGIGNIFLGDDAFGVEVARRLLARPQPPGVRVTDFGIRGLDLAYALTDGCEAAVLIDALPRGGVPGTLYVLATDPPRHGAGAQLIEAHAMDPVRVLRTAATLGTLPARVLVVGCEPGPMPEADESMSMSPVVEAAVDEAVALVESVVAELASSLPPLLSSQGVASSAAVPTPPPFQENLS